MWGKGGGDTRWRNKEVKEAASRKKNTRQCFITVLRRIRGGMKNKAASKATSEKAGEVFTGLQEYPYGMFRLVKGLKTDSKEVEGGRCMGGSDGKLGFSEKERGKV